MKFLLLVSLLFAGQVTSTSKLGWDQVAPDLISAQGYTYRYYIDGATTGTILPNVFCQSTSTVGQFLCTAPIPAIPPGLHKIQLTAENAGGVSAKSLPLEYDFTVIKVPSTPTGLRIITGG